MTQARHTQYQLSMQDLGVKQLTFIRKQLRRGFIALNNLAELYDELRLMAAPVERREVPAGARERFVETVARSASTGSKGAVTKVASIASAERREDCIDVTARAAILLMVADPAGVSPQEKRPVVKKTLLPVDRQSLEIPGRAANSRSKFKTAVAAASNTVAARMVGIF